MSQGFHRCQGVKGVSQAPGRLLHELVEQHVALTGCHLVLTDRRDPGGREPGKGLSPFLHVPLLPPRSSLQLPSQAPPSWGCSGNGTGVSPGVIVDTPAGLAAAQCCVVAVVDAARVVAEGVQLVDGASCGVRDHHVLQSRLCPLPLSLPVLAPWDLPYQTHRLCHWQSPPGSVAAAGSLHLLNSS